MVIEDLPMDVWDRELNDLFLRIGTRFTRVEPRRRMRDYVRGLLSPVGRKNSWQLAEFAGHACSACLATSAVVGLLGR